MKSLIWGEKYQLPGTLKTTKKDKRLGQIHKVPYSAATEAINWALSPKQLLSAPNNYARSSH